MKAFRSSIFLLFFLFAGAIVSGTVRHVSTPGINEASDYPQITSCNITPATLKNNRTNFIFIPDPGQTTSPVGFALPPPIVPGGHLIRSRPMSGGRWSTFYNVPLREAVFKNATGDFILCFGLLAE